MTKLATKKARIEIMEDLTSLMILAAESHYKGDAVQRDEIMDTINYMLERGIELPINVVKKVETLRFQNGSQIRSFYMH